MNFNDQIDDFLFGKLAPEEEEKFRQQRLIDSDLAQEVKKRKLMLGGLEMLGNQQTKERLKEVSKRVFKEKQENLPKELKRSRTLFLWTAAAAAIVILCIIGWQIFYPSNINPEKLFAESYQPYIEDFGSRGANTTNEYLQAGEYYQQKNYAAAIPLLQNILKDDPQNNEVELVLGDCLLSSNRVEEAISHFNTVLDRKTNLYSDPAQWFLALCYLKQNNIEECKRILKSQTEDSSADFYEEAKELLSKLN